MSRVHWRYLTRLGMHTLALIALIGGLLHAPGTASAATWQVAVGAQSPDKAIQVEQFFANDITIDVGDTVTWTSQADEPHTVTFLSGATPPPFTAPPSGGPTYNGTGLVNSGLIVNGQTFSLLFTATGNFPYVCLLHPQMTGIVRVQPPGTPYPYDQAFYNQVSAQQRTARLAAGAVFAAQGLQQAQAAGPNNVTAGIGDGIVDVMRFLPGSVTVPAGGTVVWTNRDTEVPHTITFGAAPADPEQVVGTDSAGHATITPATTSVSSGFIGQPFPNGATFSATFTTPGTYSYICALHANLGMVGSVVVTPAQTTPTATPVVPEWSPLWLFGSGLLLLGTFVAISRRRSG